MGANDVERAMLGAVLLNPTHWPQVAVLRPDDFSLDSHRMIFGRMRDLAESSVPIDTLTLVNELDRRKELEAIGDVGYISSLVDGLPDRPLDSIEHYVVEVLRYAGLRHIGRVADSIRQEADNPATTIANLTRKLLETAREAVRYEAESGLRITEIEDIPDPFSYSLEETGWIVHGLIPARGITIIAGEAGCGKTWLALTLARAMAFGDDFLGWRTQKNKALYLDRENPLNLIRDRLRVLFGGESEFRPWGLLPYRRYGGRSTKPTTRVGQLRDVLLETVWPPSSGGRMLP